MKKAALIFFFFLAVLSCTKVDPEIVSLPSDELREMVPSGWPQPAYNFSVNTVTKEKFELGRALFYETLLSKDNTVSCASCHQQFVAFAHAEHALSHGVGDLVGTRNAPGLFNLTWHPSFMHDGGVNHIQVQPLAPIANPVEMDEDIGKVIEKLQASARYRSLFNKAYASEEVNSQKLLRAMTVFMGMMYSNTSKYDLVKKNTPNIAFTEAETRGYELFKAKCNACHKEPLFSDFKYRNNGLAVDAYLKDSGRAHITGLATDRFTFKTPSLRNVTKTGPYMHDGRLTTLEQCLNHYTGGITNMENLDPVLQNGSIPLSSQEKQDIISFLNTLTDYKFMADKRFSDPNFQ